MEYEKQKRDKKLLQSPRKIRYSKKQFLQKKGEIPMKKIFYGDIYLKEEELKENGIVYPIKLEYYKTKQEGQIQEESETYGIEVIQKIYKTPEEVEEDKSSIHYVSKSEEETEHVLDILKVNGVMPVHTKEIVEELIKQRLC